MEELKVFDNEVLAKMWAGILEDQGIWSMVRPAPGAFPLPYLHGSFIPHAVYVKPEDMDRARELLPQTEQ